MNTKELLKQIGGQAAIARECAISESAVSQWVDEDTIPNARRMYLQLAHPGEHWALYHAYQKAPNVASPANIAQPATETVASGALYE